MLDIPRDASLQQIKAAYRRLAARYHPDHVLHLPPEEQAEAAARMVELNEAMDLLGDAQRKARYDYDLSFIPPRKMRTSGDRLWASVHPPQARHNEQPARPADAVNPESPEAKAVPDTEPVRQPAATPVSSLRASLLAGGQWTQSALHGWEWVLEAPGRNGSLLVTYRHVGLVSPIGARNLSVAVQALAKRHKSLLRKPSLVLVLGCERVTEPGKSAREFEALARAATSFRSAMIVVYEERSRRAFRWGRPPDHDGAAALMRLLFPPAWSEA